MRCKCGHTASWHTKVTYPAPRQPCGVCLNCSDGRGTGRACCMHPKPCPCDDFQEAA